MQENSYLSAGEMGKFLEIVTTSPTAGVELLVFIKQQPLEAAELEGTE